MKAPHLRADSLPQKYPSLFGRHTAIFSDHEKLHGALAKLKEMSRIGAETGDLPVELRPLPLLGGLLAELEAHFKREESEEYFGTIAALSPSLEEAILELRLEHKGLLRAAENLLVLAGQKPTERGLVTATDELLAWLGRHERRENAVMSEFLSNPGGI